MHTSIRLLAAVAVAGLLSQPSLAWAQPAPDIRIAMTHTGNFTVGVNGIYTIVVSNGGSTAFSGRIDVIDQVVTGLEGAHFFYMCRRWELGGPARTTSVFRVNGYTVSHPVR
jgi:hypothetical protein